MNTYTIETANWIGRAKGHTATQAAVKAGKKNPPKTIGMLVEISCRNEPTVWWDGREFAKRIMEAQKKKRKR